MDADDILLGHVRYSGDGDAVHAPLRRHAPAARRFIRSLCGKDDDAEDITEVFTGLLPRCAETCSVAARPAPYSHASGSGTGEPPHAARETATASLIGPSSAGCQSSDIVEADVVRSALAPRCQATCQITAFGDIRRTEIEDESAAVVRPDT